MDLVGASISWLRIMGWSRMKLVGHGNGLTATTLADHH
jgi:hypothetical protein